MNTVGSISPRLNMTLLNIIRQSKPLLLKKRRKAVINQRMK